MQRRSKLDGRNQASAEPKSAAGPKPKGDPMDGVQAVFSGKAPEALATYLALTTALTELGPFVEDPKKTSIHLNRKSAFAGVHPRKAAIVLVIRSARPIQSPRIRKLEKVSANRWHNEMLLSTPAEVDPEVLGWLGEAYALSA